MAAMHRHHRHQHHRHQQQKPLSMHQFVARCLEETGLEGRCGIPLRDMFALVDPADDVVFRRYAWRVLRTMRSQLRFHHMERVEAVASMDAGNGDNCNDAERVRLQQQQRVQEQRSGSTHNNRGSSDSKGMEGTGTQAAETTWDQSQQQSASPASESQEEELSSPMSSPPRRKRKWSTTLVASPSASADEYEKEQTVAFEEVHSGDAENEKAPVKKYKQKLQPVVPSARRKALKKQRRLLTAEEKANRRPVIKKERRSSMEQQGETGDNESSSGSDDEEEKSGEDDDGDEDDVEMVEVMNIVEDTIRPSDGDDVREQILSVTGADKSGSSDNSTTAQLKTSRPRSSEAVQNPESIEWIYRSPRGYVLGDEVMDSSTMSYEDAVAENSVNKSVLGVVACKELRLKYLGVTDATSIDTLSPQFDLLEMIGRAREQGENAAVLSNSNVFGDSRKLHYLLNMLIANNYIEKNMVTSDQRRFNILHLTRFASKFHPSMVSANATMERATFPKDFLPYVMAEMLIARGERACVFADIGRELGYDKRHQEKLRKYFFHQMHVHREFPLELFMARCNTGSTEYRGRKLWCIRLRHALTRGGKDNSAERFEPIDPPAVPTTGPVIERGIMEQVYFSIKSRRDAGATIPEIRDMLGVPTFKLPYKLAQGLITKYNLIVEQVVVGKNTMYRMFIPGHNGAKHANIQGEEKAAERAKHTKQIEDTDEDKTATGKLQPSTLRAATRGVLVTSTVERRRNHMLERIRKDKIVPVHQLRTGLMAMERDPELGGSDLGIIDIRSVRRILDELEAGKLVVSVDITLPPKRVLQKSDRVVKCVCLPGYQRNREAILAFVDAYMEEQQQRFLSDIGQPEKLDTVVISSRSRGRKMAAVLVQNEEKEVIKYAAASYKATRANMVKHNKQSRRLGMIFGMLCRCRALHLLLWEKIHLLRHKTRRSSMGFAENTALAIDQQDEAVVPSVEEEQPSKNGGKRPVHSAHPGVVVFALHEFLELLNVKEYLHFAGVNELLTESEENKVRMAIARGDSWEILSSEIQRKIRGCEAERFSRIMRILIELGLVQVENDSSSGLLNMFRSDDFEAMVSQVANATLSGGLLKIKERVRITVKRGDKILKQLPTKQSYVYAAGFSNTSRSDHFVGKVPLEFELKDTEDAKEYWKALRFLSLEGARIGSGAADGDSVSVNLDSELIHSAPLKDYNILSMRVWMTSDSKYSTAKSKAAAAAAEPMKILKRKRFQNNVVKSVNNSASGTNTNANAKKKQKTAAANASKRIGSHMVPSTGDTEAGVSKFRRLVSNKQSVRASKWTLEEDMKLMDAYMDELSCKWFIEIPLALQKADERLAFRNTSLERTRISWKNLGKVLGKRFFDCFLRVKELMTAPAVRARVENTKLMITQMKNPGGRFHEELAVAKHPRLAALLNRALQILFHDRASYYPVLADMLISQWTEGEVKLVWRYLWLAGVITRTRKPIEGDQKQRGFTIHSRVHEKKSLNIPYYSMEVFCEAAEYAAFIQENVKEAAMLNRDGRDVRDDEEREDGDQEAGESDYYFEHELEPNTGTGQIAVELSSMILSVSELVPEYVEPSGDRRAAANSEEAKRTMAVKGYAGHLATYTGGAVPDDFLKEYWTVKSRVYVNVQDEAKHEMVMETAKKSLEAFSTCPALDEEESGFGLGVSREKEELVSSLVLGALHVASSSGLSFQELCEKVQASASSVTSSSPDSTTSNDTTNKTTIGAMPVNSSVRCSLDVLLSQGRVLEVNGFTHVRFVLKEHSDIWTLHPYRISSNSGNNSSSNTEPPDNSEKVFFQFDKQQTIVARPWFLLDGSPNTKVEIVLKRKVVNIIMCNPGIQDHALHRKMRKLLSLQNLRVLIDELIADEIVHARLVRGGACTPASIFKKTSWKRPRSDERALRALAPGELRFVDTLRDEVHYFPAVNCFELLGAAACDADVRDN